MSPGKLALAILGAIFASCLEFQGQFAFSLTPLAKILFQAWSLTRVHLGQGA